MSAIPFSPIMLSSVAQLRQNYFTGEQELTQIALPIQRTSLSNRQIAWIFITAPLNLCFAVFLNTLGFILQGLHFQEQANHLYLQASYVTKDFGFAWGKFVFGKRLIVPTHNEYQIELSDLYGQKPILRQDIPNSELRSTLHPKLKKISFNRIQKGVCHGAVQWFNTLFLKSLNTSLKDQVSTLKEYLIPIAQLFEEGQPRQAGLLQSLYGCEEILLDLKKNKCAPLPADLTNKDSALEAIRHLPDGVCAIEVGGHELSYIQCNGEACIWDPNQGLIAVEEAEQLLEIILDYAPNKSNSSPLFIYHGLNSTDSLFQAIWNLVSS